MDPHRELAALLDLAEEIGLEIRPAPPSTEPGGGAVARLRGKTVVFLDSSAPAVERIDVVARALRDRPELAQRYLPPALRQRLEAADADQRESEP